MNQKKMVAIFGVCGLGVAALLGVIRIYLLCQYPDVIYDGEWFNTFTLILWPGSFYLTILQAKEPTTKIVAVCSIAICANALIYAFVGWIVLRLSRLLQKRS